MGGADLLRDPVGVRRRIGYVPQAIGQTMGGTNPASLIGEELLDQAALYHIAKPEARGAEQLTAQLDLTGLDERLVKTLSGGQRRPAGHRRSAWSTSRRSSSSTSPPPGLTRRAGSNLRTTSGACAIALGTTIFLTTHYLEEADALCDRIFIIDHGVIVAEGTPDELKRG